MKKRIVSVVVAMAMLLAMVGGCSEKKTASSETTKATQSETEQSTSSVAASEDDQNDEESVYPIDYVDAYGNECTIENEPETIVSVSPAMTEIIYALGQEDKLIGRTDYCDYPEDVLAIDSVGAIDTPDTEAIAELDPDIILASSIFSEESYNTLTDLGYTVVIVRDETTLDGMFDVIDEVGNILGCPTEACELTDELQTRLDTIADETTEGEDAPSVYYCMGYGDYGDYTAGGDTFINDIIEAAGGVNAAAEVSGWSYSTEALLEADPDYILVPAWGYDAFLTTEPYSELTAVQEGHVISIDNNMFERQGPRNVDAVELVHEAINAQ